MTSTGTPVECPNGPPGQVCGHNHYNSDEGCPLRAWYLQRVASRKGGGGGGGRAPPPGMDYSARVKAVAKQSEVLMAQLALLEKCKISSSDKKTNAYFTDYDMLLESCSVLFNNVPIAIEGCT